MQRRSGPPFAERCSGGLGRHLLSDDLAEKSKRCAVGSQHFFQSSRLLPSNRTFAPDVLAGGALSSGPASTVATSRKSDEIATTVRRSDHEQRVRTSRAEWRLIDMATTERFEVKWHKCETRRAVPSPHDPNRWELAGSCCNVLDVRRPGNGVEHSCADCGKCVQWPDRAH